MQIARLLILLVALTMLATVGCATAPTPCPSAREVMAEKGKVLMCWHDQEDTYERITRCLVVYPGETRAVTRRVWKRHCSL